MKGTPVLKETLLRELKPGFSYDTLSKMESVCAFHLAKTDNSDKIFIFVLRDFCFHLKSHIDAIQPITTNTHKIIETTVSNSLIESIFSLENCELAKQVSVFNALINDLTKVKKIKD
jgi:hypothetical protein